METRAQERESAIPVWRVPVAASEAWLRACVTTRAGGASAGAYASLNLGLSSGDDPARVHANRARLRRALGIEALPLHHLRQVHGTRIVAAPGCDDVEGDGLWTATPGVVLAIGVADCTPIFVWDVRRRAIGLVHAGWRGTAAGILAAALAGFAARGSRPGDLHVAMGPCIGPCCYPVEASVAGQFPAAAVVAGPDGPRVDLRTANRLQAEAAGLAPSQIHADPPCTRCESRTFFSYRAHGARSGRMWALAWIEV